MQVEPEEKSGSRLLDCLDSLSRRKFVFVLVVAAIIGLLFGIVADERGWFSEGSHVEETE